MASKQAACRSEQADGIVGAGASSKRAAHTVHRFYAQGGDAFQKILSKFWGFAGIAEQCPRFASPDRISEVLVINAVFAKIDPLLVRIIIRGRNLTGGNGGRLGTSPANSE